MEPSIQWAITSLISILAIFVGRAWERYDRRQRKDRELVDKVIAIIPIGSDTYRFLSEHDFGGMFRQASLRPLRDLELLLSQPSNFFLEKKLEQKKQDLCQAITEFEELVIERTFPHDVQPDYAVLPDPYDIAMHRIRHLDTQNKMSDEEFNQLVAEARKTQENIRQKLNSLSTTVCENMMH